MKYTRITFDLLTVVVFIGSLSAPLIGPLRENIQDTLNISRSVFGLFIFLSGILAGLIGLFLSIRMKSFFTRPRFIRLGISILLIALIILSFVPLERGWPSYLLVFGFFMLPLSGKFIGVANSMMKDIWHKSPHTGIILLHATNSIGKVLAPTLVLFIGTNLHSNARIFLVLVALLTIDVFTWKRHHVKSLEKMESMANHDHALGKSWKDSLFWFAALQFVFIAGSEAGVVSILASFITVFRNSPLPFITNEQWPAFTLIIMQMGIVAGRFAFVYLSRSIHEQRIIAICLAFVFFVFPSVLLENPVLYVPSLFLFGIAFSATWPAFFSVAIRHFPGDSSAFAISASIGSLTGVNFFILIASVIGNKDSFLPLAVIVTGISLLFFAGCFYLLPSGRQLRES